MSPGRSPPSFRNPVFRAGSGTPPAVFPEHPGEDAADAPEPDEMTGIVMRGPNSSASAGMNYQSMATTDTTGGARARKSNTGRRRDTAHAGGGGGMGCDGANGDYEDNKEAAAWWKTQLAKFGSIELENKGSVARDHLALGWFPPGLFSKCMAIG